MQGRINKVLDELTCSTTTETRDKGLRSIIEQAVELSRLFRVQQAQFKIHMPIIENNHPLLFDAEMMEDITGEDDHELNNQHVDCVIFPCVMKFGDEIGDNVSFIVALGAMDPYLNDSSAGTAEKHHRERKGVLSRALVEGHNRPLPLEENALPI